MALINCKECGNQVSTQAKACPHCGATQDAGNKKTGFKWGRWLFVYPMLTIVVLSIVGMSISASKKSEWIANCESGGISKFDCETGLNRTNNNVTKSKEDDDNEIKEIQRFLLSRNYVSIEKSKDMAIDIHKLSKLISSKTKTGTKNVIATQKSIYSELGTIYDPISPMIIEASINISKVTGKDSTSIGRLVGREFRDGSNGIARLVEAFGFVDKNQVIQIESAIKRNNFEEARRLTAFFMNEKYSAAVRELEK